MNLRTTLTGFISVNTLLVAILLFLSAPKVYAQKVSYIDLARENRGQNFYFKKYTLPGKTDSTTTFALIFKTAHSFLTFKKLDDQQQLNSSDTAKYFSTLEMNIEVFKNPSQASEGKKSKKGDFSQQGLESAARSFWKDTLFTDSYEKTQASNLFIEGHFEIQLKPGEYGYILQLVRTEGANQETSRQQTVSIPKYGAENASIYLLENNADISDNILNLINFGSNAHFGKDFKLLVHFPAYNPFREYELTIKKRNGNTPDSLKVEPIFSKKITKDLVYSNFNLGITDNKDRVALELEKISEGNTYAFLSIPNSTFPNASYTITLHDNEEEKIIARTVYDSRWVNIPTSLLNVDVALNMLRFILPEEKIKQMREGTQAQKQQTFENFWDPKDPTPNTEYNELMAEYYRRIDYAFRNFSSFDVPGYDTDQGNIYIRKGPPNKIDRKFPLNQPVVEIWRYDDKTFIFEATSGFGDFKLIETTSS